MKFRDIYSDIVNYLDLQADYKLYHNDIVFAINDAIRELRFEFLKSNDVGDNFTIRESIDIFTQSTEYPYLKEATLTTQPIKDFQISKGYFNANCYLTSYEIPDSVVTLSKDSLGVKGNYTYILTEDVDGVNTFNKVYDPFKVRPYYKNNGIKYKIGDYIKDVKNNKVYKVLTAFTANFDTELDGNANVEKVVWKKLTNAYFSVVFYPLQRVNELRYFDNIEYSHAFSVRNDKVFVTPNVAKLFIEYVPEWTNVTDLEAELNLPDVLIPNIKKLVINTLVTKLGLAERTTANE